MLIAHQVNPESLSTFSSSDLQLRMNNVSAKILQLTVFIAAIRPDSTEGNIILDKDLKIFEWLMRNDKRLKIPSEKIENALSSLWTAVKHALLIDTDKRR